MSDAWNLLNTLFVMTAGSYLHLDNDTIRIEVEHTTRMRVPLHHLGAIVTVGHVMMSPGLLGRCASDGITVSLLDRNGRFMARVEGPTSGNVLLRRAQHERAMSDEQTLELARSFVAGKLRNSRTVLQRGARETTNDDDRAVLEAAVTKFNASQRAATVAGDTDALRGVEGEAARTYFGAINAILKPAMRPHFAITNRNRRPPRDRLNALLSYLYTLLTHDCRSALETVGLDPQVGYLHVLRPGRPALALDLVEEFRSIMADRLALTLINRGQLKANDFRVTEGGGVLMSDNARRTIAIAWQNRKQETLHHPLLDTDVPIGVLPQIQARLLARTLRNDVPAYLPFVAK
ncbi:MAG TPA: type I-C CRISPR-associated endonuclease Cas1c [Rhodanobacteraceae bacterium]